ncbi:MAG: hypothetical protein II733_03600 [Succinivibrio sp.]|jgi:hypothetical protein|nr:hypothetical protein [Succinivibrio sp.]
MADKLDWLNKHYVLMNHKLVEDVVKNENYKVPFEYQDLAKEYPGSEDFSKKLAEQNKFKEASTFLSFNMHHRAMAWWGYCCVMSLRKELEEAPAPEVDWDNLGKAKPFEIPDWAKAPVSPSDIVDPEKKAELLKQLSDIRQKCEDYKKTFPQKYLDLYSKVESIFIEEFKKKNNGKTPMDLFHEASEKLKNVKPDDVPFVDPNSPIFKARDELRADLEKIRVDTLKTVKAAVPMKNKEELKLQKGNSLDAAYAYICDPSDKNAKACLDLGNLCPDTPEGLLSLVCFWSYGNMCPGSNMVVKTPAGLAANGMDKLILMCALAKGGTCKFDERMEQYFLIGQEVITAQNLWADQVETLNVLERSKSESEFDGVVSTSDEVEGSKSADTSAAKEDAIDEHANPLHRFKFDEPKGDINS